MDEVNSQSVGILDIMAEFLKGFFSEYFPEQTNIEIVHSKRKLHAYVPNEDKTDAIVVRITRLDDCTVSAMVYMHCNPDTKLYMGHYNKSCDDEQRNYAKLSRLSVDLLTVVAGNQYHKEEARPDPIVHAVNVENIVRVTGVQTMQVTEQHILAVSFDGQPPINLAVSKDQLAAFAIGNTMARLPLGFQLLDRNPVIH
jgi:hypothetical protein